MSGFIANTKDVVVDSYAELKRISAGWKLSKKGMGVLVKNAYFDYPTPGAGDPAISVNGAWAYYKWDGSQFITIANGAPASKRKTVLFAFNSNLYTEQQNLFKGQIGFISNDFSAELQSIDFESRLDTDLAWTIHDDVNSLQAWITANVVGDENVGTKYWIKCIATYNPSALGQAENLFSYQVG